MTAVLDADRVRALNDILRHTLSGGTLVLTAGVITLGRERQQVILDAVAAFDRFDSDNDPHDFGAVEVAGKRVLWKIDYHDHSGRYASPDLADTSVTRRVLTVMLAEEY
ncbi:DUF3768 domain-containing protein [Methylorubrum extorquens]|uniref:DUF3768 domain-containing protein n=1 Tax=Methylorubrum extorquens (strain ATCC 14718 / DSM 1338 / JCM 2805 / NCIMB 9133 / AM1) TaxID=272630 RepID=C5APF1_METEA|nr:DUF3768 domain-containing protein [Methylorubrum extorquens]ACS38036.1 conserved hypothetical protein [Methylorubrum extorquens AM1]MCP1543921.1 hypothetical protein [Methylorubrum extorquens]MCP1588733.1 hypothetical protein [Methylorubrum extorquens]